MYFSVCVVQLGFHEGDAQLEGGIIIVRGKAALLPILAQQLLIMKQ